MNGESVCRLDGKSKHEKTMKHQLYKSNFIIMSSSKKDDTINNIFYDRSGFGSIASTYNDVKQKDSSITLNDVKEWFKKNVEQKKQLRGQNSFIPKEPYWEYQFDLFFVNDIPDQKFKVGVAMLDIFTKFATVIPIKSKSEGDVASGMIQGFKEMGKTPKLLYTDDEASLSTDATQTYLRESNIHHHRTRGHANFVERFIRTFKKMMYDRIEADEKERGKTNIQWIDYVFELLLTHNNKMVHSAHNMTPKEARKPSNEMNVKLNMSMNAKRNRTYPEVSEGDKVNILRKKGVGEKGRKSTWSQMCLPLREPKRN